MIGSFFPFVRNDYGGDTVVFALFVVCLMLPLAILITASLLDGLMRQRACRGHPAPAPLSLRQSISLADRPRYS
jgi:hypothetical protein